MKKPTFDKKRPLSWSAISSFEYDPEQWYQSYVLGIRPSSKEMTFGSEVDKRIQEDPAFLPQLPRYSIMQHKMEATFSGIPLIGYSDGLDLAQFLLADYKTGKKAWTQDRADETGQLTMYLLMLHLTQGIHPDKFACFIHWLPTKDNGDFTISFTDPARIETFETKRTMVQVLTFAQRMVRVYKEMQVYAKAHN